MAEIFKNAIKSAAQLSQILRMVTVEIVIISSRVMGVRVTISFRYATVFISPSWGDAFVSSFVFLFVTLGVRNTVRATGA